MGFGWLRRTGQFWKLRAEAWVGLIGFGTVVGGFAALLASFVAGRGMLWAAGAAWAVYGALLVAAAAVKRRGIRCPACGHRPAAGGLHPDALYDRLAGLEACPACGHGG